MTSAPSRGIVQVTETSSPSTCQPGGMGTGYEPPSGIGVRSDLYILNAAQRTTRRFRLCLATFQEVPGDAIET